MRARSAAAKAWRQRGDGGAGAVWAVAGREAVQHADSDAGWRLGRHDLDLSLDPRVRVRVRVRV